MSYQESSGPELLIQHTGQIFPLGTESVTIGRYGDNSIVLADPKVSAHHARIQWQAETGSFLLEDLGSEQGTYVNEVRVTAPAVLRHGDVIRMGNTLMDLRLPPPSAGGMIGPPADLEGPGTSTRGPVWTAVLIALLAGLAIVCAAVFAVLLLTGGRGTPDVIIQSPQAGAQISVGNEIILKATASGAKDINLLELSVDGSLIASSSNPGGASSLTVSEPWAFDAPGEHLISAEAFTLSGRASRPASVKVSIVAAEIKPSETPTPEEPTETPTPTETPRPEDTATPVPTVVPPPEVEYFQVNPTSIDAGGCATLQWGKVTNATAVRIEPDIGGVGTPGSQTVCPIENTTYVITAEGPGGETQASTTLTIIGGLPDLLIESIVFVPDPAVVGQENQVQVTIRNAGIGAAGAFNWEWQANSEVFDGRIFGLNAGEATVETILWSPEQASDQLETEARVDTGDEVRETDKSNNQLAAMIQVIELPSQPETVVLKSMGSLDGYWLNDGTGSTEDDILVGNGELVDPFGELVARGFLSFDVSSIPSDATVEEVELRFYQNAVQGNPYDKLGNLVLEHVYYGSSLNDSAYDTPAFDSADIAAQPLPGAWYILADPTLASWIESGLQAGQPQFQLRLQFRRETDGDGTEDWISIVPGGGALGSRNQPQLTITYTP
jgi:hypothetical protein